MTVCRIDSVALDILRATSLSPSVEVIASSFAGLPVPRVEGKSVHSNVDPIAEADRLVDRFLGGGDLRPGSSVLLLGNGFGYVARSLLVRGYKPVAIEPSADILAAFSRVDDVDGFSKALPLFHLNDPSLLHRAGSLREHVLGASGVLVLPYVRMLFPHFAEAVERKREAILGASKAFFRVSVVNAIEGGPVEMACSIVPALASLGHSVDFVDVSGFGGVLGGLNRLGMGKDSPTFGRNVHRLAEWLSDMALERIESFDPAVVLVLAQAPLSTTAVKTLRESGRRVLFWFFEDHMHFRYWEESASAFDAFFPIQKGGFPANLRQVGQRNVHYLPMAADPAVFHQMTLSSDDRRRFGGPVSFMGAGYYNRVRFFNHLLNRDFKIFGVSWPPESPVYCKVQEGGRRVSPEESAKIFNATDVNVNLHSSTSHEGPNPFGDFVNPRTFEIAACGAFQLVDRRSLLSELFDLETELATFTGRDDFLALLDHYLANPEERSAMAAKARERVLREHTYQERLREMFEVVFETCPPESRRRLAIASEIERDGGAGWGEMLASFQKDRPVDFDALYLDIVRRLERGGLSRTEIMTLMLGELRRGRR